MLHAGEFRIRVYKLSLCKYLGGATFVLTLRKLNTQNGKDVATPGKNLYRMLVQKLSFLLGPGCADFLF